jgi:hypothetical protein
MYRYLPVSISTSSSLSIYNIHIFIYIYYLSSVPKHVTLWYSCWSNLCKFDSIYRQYHICISKLVYYNNRLNGLSNDTNYLCTININIFIHLVKVKNI